LANRFLRKKQESLKFLVCGRRLTDKWERGRSSQTIPMRTQRRSSPDNRPAAIILLIVAFAPVGCVHPNIPSIRYGNEPGPHGSPVILEESCVPETVVGQDPAMLADGYLDSSCGGEVEQDVPEAPWPRFHPLPTRPVLGGAAIGN
jgi:hypothetical protein